MFNKPLFIFEMANNHQGSVEHGKRIIQDLNAICNSFREEFDFAIKFQYRNLDSFIHPDYKERYDVKNIKRFLETKLMPTQFDELLSEVKKCNFITLCTPFDENSVDLIIKQDIEIIKIASCSFTDWPLLEKIASTNKRVIASCAGASSDDIKRVVSFFKHRNIDLSLMHCVAEYPTMKEHLQMNQIDYLKRMFPDLAIGFSTHEEPNDDIPIRLAVAKRARIFEKHIGVETETIKLNGYSANPNQVKIWLQAASDTYKMCGIENERYQPTEKETKDLLALKRGVFAKKQLRSGEMVSRDNTFFAFPCKEDQIVTSDISKYAKIEMKTSVLEKGIIKKSDVDIIDSRATVIGIVRKVLAILKKSGAIIPENSVCNLSHHYGIDKYETIGVAMIECINREYCKKILVVLPGQHHPEHFHKKKEETFTVLWGQLDLVINGKKSRAQVGKQVLVEREMKHSFASECGCVFEEISTTHYIDDSYYDESNFVSPRKTNVYLTRDLLGSIEGYNVQTDNF